MLHIVYQRLFQLNPLSTMYDKVQFPQTHLDTEQYNSHIFESLAAKITCFEVVSLCIFYAYTFSIYALPNFL